jgi:autotransporter-associated beta strand protein
MKKSSVAILASFACFTGIPGALLAADYYVTQSTNSGSPVNCPDSTYSNCTVSGNTCCTLGDALTLANSNSGSTIYIEVANLDYTGTLISPCSLTNPTTIESGVGGSTIVFNGNTSTCTTDFGSTTVFQPKAALTLTNVVFQDSNTGTNVINIDDTSVTINNTVDGVFSNNTWTVEGSGASLSVSGVPFPDDIIFATDNTRLTIDGYGGTFDGNITASTGVTGSSIAINSVDTVLNGTVDVDSVEVGSGSLALSGNCTGTTITLNNATVLYVNSSSLGTPTIVNQQQSILFGADLTLDGTLATPNTGSLSFYPTFNDQGYTVQIDALLSDSASRWFKTGSGIIILTNNDNVSSNYYIAEGVLSVSSPLQLGSSGDETLAGGTLFASSSLTLSDSFTLTVSSSGNLAAGAGETLTIDAPLLGSGTLTIGVYYPSLTASGTVALTGSSGTFDGNLVIGATNGGMDYPATLSVSNLNDLGTLSNITLQAGSTLITAETFYTTASFTIDNGILSPASNTTLTLYGSITPMNSSYDLTVTGGGTVVLGGSNNSYTANITVNDSSTVSVGDSSNLGDSSTSLLTLNKGSIAVTSTITLVQDILLASSGGSFYVSSSKTATYNAGSFSGSGTLTKTGAGTLILTGTGTYTGKTYVTSGTLDVEGTITSSTDPIVYSGAILTGTGTVGDTYVYGALKGGNPTGTLNVAGNLTFESGGSLGVVATDSTVSMVNTTGDITIDPSAHFFLALAPGHNCSVVCHDEPVLVLSGNSLTGRFDTSFSDYSFTELLYTDRELYFNLRSALDLASGRNAMQVAGAVDAAIDHNRRAAIEVLDSGNIDLSYLKSLLDVPKVIASLIPFSEGSGMTYALNQLQPSQLKGLAIAQENNAVRVRQSLSQRMENELNLSDCLLSDRQDAQGNKCCEKPKKCFTAWIGGLGDTLEQDSLTTYLGPLPGYRVNTGGVITGFDAMFAGYFYAGALGAYTNSNVHFKEEKGTGSISSGYAGLYFSAVGSGNIGKMFYGNLSVIGSWSKYRTERNIQYGKNLGKINLVAKSDHGGNQILSHVDTGINIDSLGFTLRPFDSFDYISQKERSYSEHNAGQWDLTIGKKNAILIRNELGLEFAKCLCFCSSKWIFSPKISWVREVRVKGDTLNVRFTDAAETFFIQGYFPDRSLVAPGLSVTGMMLEDALQFDLYYNGEFKGNYSSNSVGGQVSYSF